jgi:transcription elongation factor Elf1
VPKDKTKYECAYCGERFIKMHDHMSHVIEQHDTGYRERKDRLQRPITCWGCAKAEVTKGDGPDGWFICQACGYELPRNWVNGQLMPDENGVIK